MMPKSCACAFVVLVIVVVWCGAGAVVIVPMASRVGPSPLGSARVVVVAAGSVCAPTVDGLVLLSVVMVWRMVGGGGGALGGGDIVRGAVRRSANCETMNDG